MRVVFAGTPDFAAKHLQSVIDEGFDVVAVYTQPDRPSGRGKKINQSPVKKLSLDYNIDVFQPISLKNLFLYIPDYLLDDISVIGYNIASQFER